MISIVHYIQHKSKLQKLPGEVRNNLEVADVGLASIGGDYPRSSSSRQQQSSEKQSQNYNKTSLDSKDIAYLQIV